MANRSIFEIIGPVMIGPSSSHTAGAVRLGRIARLVLDDKPAQAKVTLYGSFAQTYQGHGTDRALVGGILGMNTADERIKEAFEIAAEEGLEVILETAEDPERHPNTVSINLTADSGKKIFIEGSSVGGGNILITKINRFEVSFNGRYPTLLVEHADKPGVIGRITTALGQKGINIAEMKMARNHKGANNFVVIETDQPIPKVILNAVASLSDINSVIKIELN